MDDWVSDLCVDGMMDHYWIPRETSLYIVIESRIHIAIDVWTDERLCTLWRIPRGCEWFWASDGFYTAWYETVLTVDDPRPRVLSLLWLATSPPRSASSTQPQYTLKSQHQQYNHQRSSSQFIKNMFPPFIQGKTLVLTTKILPSSVEYICSSDMKELQLTL